MAVKDGTYGDKIWQKWQMNVAIWQHRLADMAFMAQTQHGLETTIYTQYSSFTFLVLVQSEHELPSC